MFQIEFNIVPFGESEFDCSDNESVAHSSKTEIRFLCYLYLFEQYLLQVYPVQLLWI